MARRPGTPTCPRGLSRCNRADGTFPDLCRPERIANVVRGPSARCADRRSAFQAVSAVFMTSGGWGFSRWGPRRSPGFHHGLVGGGQGQPPPAGIGATSGETARHTAQQQNRRGSRYFPAMCARIDSHGGLVIPKAFREAAGLRPGTRVRFRVEAAGLLIESASPEPAPLSVTLERRGTMVVAVPRTPVPVLSSEDVERTIDEIRERHTDAERDP